MENGTSRKRFFTTTNVSWLAALASAGMAYSAFRADGRGATVLFALAPILAPLRLGMRPRTAAAVFFTWGMVFWTASLSWFPAIIPNGGPWPLVILGMAGLSAYCALYAALFGWLAAHLWRAAGDAPGWRRCLAVPAEAVLWAGLECVRSRLGGGFAWDALGTPLGSFPRIAFAARLGGVFAVSAVAVLVSGGVAGVIARMVRSMTSLPPDPRDVRSKLARSAESWTAFALALALVFAAGEPPDVETRPATVVLLQGNSPCVFLERENPGAFDARCAYTGLLARAETPAGRRVWTLYSAAEAPDGPVAVPDLLLLPESALSAMSGGRSPEPFLRDLSKAAFGAAVIAGADAAEIAADGSRRIYNAAVFASGGRDLKVYKKQHLVPFGEYIPFDKTFTSLQKLSPIGVSLWPGEPMLFDLPLRSAAGKTVKVAPLICYEDTDAALSRRAAADGAQMLALITNDNWFYGSREPAAHFAQSVFRAIETGLPLVRTGNSGVSGCVAPDGSRTILRDAGGKPLVDAAGSLCATVPVPVDPPLTPYTRFGDAPLACAFALVLAALAAAHFTACRKERKNENTTA